MPGARYQISSAAPALDVCRRSVRGFPKKVIAGTWLSIEFDAKPLNDEVRGVALLEVAHEKTKDLFPHFGNTSRGDGPTWLNTRLRQ